MPQFQPLPVADLKLDLQNYRIPPASNEVDSVHALIAISPTYFWGLARSLMEEDGYDGWENIAVLRTAAGDIVREGNRRIGALKLIHGLLPRSKFDVPDDIEESIKKLATQWKADNARVPCLVYGESEAAVLDRKVSRTHGRGETAGRLKWESVAKARYDRDVNKRPQPALEMLDTYLDRAKKITQEQREEWGGTFPLTVLKEAMQKVAARYNLGSAADIVTELDNNAGLATAMGLIVYDIAIGKLETRDLRPTTWGNEYGLPAAPAAPASNTSTNAGLTANSTGGANVVPAVPATQTPASPAAVAAAPRAQRKAYSLNDPRSVRRELGRLHSTSAATSKVITLRDEARKLQLKKTPISFCIVLRSMFDLAATAYCSKHKLPTVKVTPKGQKEKTLVELLNDASKHLQARINDRGTISDLKTAAVEVGSPHGLLSVPTMNRLVHGGTSTITEPNLISGFHKIFPLLLEMSK